VAGGRVTLPPPSCLNTTPERCSAHRGACASRHPPHSASRQHFQTKLVLRLARQATPRARFVAPNDTLPSLKVSMMPSAITLSTLGRDYFQ
jgi:hypothetical protein